MEPAAYRAHRADGEAPHVQRAIRVIKGKTVRTEQAEAVDRVDRLARVYGYLLREPTEAWEPMAWAEEEAGGAAVATMA